MADIKASDTKVALVVGGGQGIGRAAVERLLADGFKVGLGDWNFELAQDVAQELGGKEAGIIPVQVDASNRDSVYAAVEETTKEFGGFDVIVNNAGIAPQIPLEDITEEDVDKIFNVNYKGVLWGTQAAAKKFKELGHGGKIINATSQAGVKGNKGIPLYSSTKFAVRGLTQVTARDLADDGITVNAYAPGIVKTPLMKGLAEELAENAGKPAEWGWEQFTKDISLGRLSESEDVAKIIGFLAGPDSDYITGQTIIVDGGMVFH